MATKHENEKLEEVDKRVERLEVRFDEVVIPKLNKVVDFVEEHKSGIKLSSLLNNQILTIILGGMVLAGIYIAAKGGV